MYNIDAVFISSITGMNVQILSFYLLIIGVGFVEFKTMIFNLASTLPLMKNKVPEIYLVLCTYCFLNFLRD